MKPKEYYMDLLSQASGEKDRDADQLDQWARESRSGGWSTHQVEPMMRKADALRREASELRRVIRLVSGTQSPVLDVEGERPVNQIRAAYDSWRVFHCTPENAGVFERQNEQMHRDIGVLLRALDSKTDAGLVLDLKRINPLLRKIANPREGIVTVTVDDVVAARGLLGELNPTAQFYEDDPVAVTNSETDTKNRGLSSER